MPLDPRLAEELVEDLIPEDVVVDVVCSHEYIGELPDPFEEVLGG